MITPSDQPNAPLRRLVCCAVRDEEYCFELSDIRSIHRAHQLTLEPEPEVAGTRAAPLGWVAAQQTRLPVYDLAQRLHLHDRPADVQVGFVLVLNTPQPYALRVDRLTGSGDLPAAQLTALPPIVSAGATPLFKGIARLAEKWLLCADADRLATGPPEPFPSPLPPSAPLITPEEAEAVPASQARSAQILIFSAALPLGQTKEDSPPAFGLSTTQVQEVAAFAKIIPVPQAPPYVLGITNWRNWPVPVIDLKTRLGLTPTSVTRLDPKSRFLVARVPGQGGAIGLLVNPQVKTFRLPIPYQAPAQPLALKSEFVKGVFDLEGVPFVIPDLEAVLTPERT